MGGRARRRYDDNTKMYLKVKDCSSIKTKAVPLHGMEALVGKRDITSTHS
jgi:hypothetical protein